MIDEKVIGIDLGRTNSYSAVLVDGEPEIIPTAEGDRATPTAVTFTDDAKLLVGAPARRAELPNPEGTVTSVRERLGEGSKFVTPLAGAREEYTPPELASMVLGKIKREAEKYLDRRVERAVITVPVSSSEDQRRATREAMKLAGLEVARLVEEPAAACLAYGLDGLSSRKILVYDLGRFAFTASLLESGRENLEVLVTGRDTSIGGRRFRRRIIDWVVEEFGREEGIDLSEDESARQRLKTAAEDAKKYLSTHGEVTINLPYITTDRTGPKHFEKKLARSEFEEMIEGYLEEAVEVVESVLSEANVGSREVDPLVLVGGSTRIPRVREMLEAEFGADLNEGIEPSEVVARGAAVLGGRIVEK